MAIEKGIGSGIGEPEVIPQGQAELDIIEFPAQPRILEMDDGSAIIGEIDEEVEVAENVPFDANLADYVDESELGPIASDLSSDIDDDLSSRQDWEDSYKRGIELLGMNYEERSQPFEGATGVVHPLLAESVTQFQAQAYREMLPSGGPVRTQTMGAETPELVAQAQRVKDYMNYMITYEMEEYDPETDQMLFYLPIVGSTFKKVYFDPLMQRPVSKFVHAEDVVVPYGATDLLTAPRITHIIRMDKNEVLKLQLAGFYKDIELPGSSYSSEDFSGVREAIDDAQGVQLSGSGSEELVLHEVHTSLDLPGFEDMDEEGEPTGLKIPYIVTILESNGDILSIRRNYDEMDPFMRRQSYFVHYKFLPGLGFYGFGLTHMIGGLSQASTSILRQLIDAGTLSNLPAGFKARGARIRDEDEPLQPGEFRDIDSAGMDIRQSIMPLPFKEPSQTLYSLLGGLVEAGRRFASMADMKIGEMGGETPVGTTMAIMERGTKVMSAIHKRLHYAQKQEFKILANIFARNTAPVYPYANPGAPPEIKQQDFDDRIDVLPVSDPNIFSMSQRIALAQTELQLVQSNPEIHGGPQGLYQAYRNMYEALGVTNIDALLPVPAQPQPMNPAKENQEAMRGQRIQAFPEQNHQAHVEAHLAILSTPVAQANATIVMTLQGHIQEHLGMMAEMQAQQEVMSQLAPEAQMMLQQNPQMGQQVQAEIANRAAELIGELTEQYAQAVSPADSSQTDPLVAIRQQELALKGAEIQAREKQFEAKQELEKQKEQNDVLLAQQRLDLSEEATSEKTRVAEERIQTQRDIAAANLQRKM
tara:strand:+ start:4681 stop:7128 length:2448 start_codon:yes stop_codon:yes gene_type:complete